MIPSLDTYVYKQVKTKMKAILSKPHIIDEALRDMDQEARDNFKKTYCGPKAPREITVSYAFPQQKESFDARVVIQLGVGQETNDSIGSVEATYLFRETEAKIESAVIQEDQEKGKLYIEVEELIGSLDTIELISFSARDHMALDGNRIYFERTGNESLIGMWVTVHYTGKEPVEGGREPKGVKKGFTSTDIVEITPFSTNMDTARCLDAIMKVILIIMREDPEEKNMFALQNVKFLDMQTLINDADRIVFGRPFSLQYTVSYSVDFDFTREIKEIILKGDIFNE